MSALQLKLSAFANGILVPIEAVPDPVFAGRMMGDGLAIEPQEGVLYAPCDGRIVQLQASRHACILETESGARLVLHIGVDTVLLKGEGFVARVAQDEVVRAGQPLIAFDLAVLKRHGKPAVTILVVENGDAHAIVWRSNASTMRVGDALLTLAPPGTGATDKDATQSVATASGESSAFAESANGWAIVRHAGGLHARPCAMLAHAVKPFAAEVEILVRGQHANVRSATAVMSLSVAEGEEVQLKATGAQAGDALEAAILALETVTAAAPPAPVVPQVVSTSTLLPNQLAGVVATPGFAMGAGARFVRSVGQLHEQGEGEVAENRALAAALQAVVAEIESSITEAERRGLGEQSEIFAAHRVLVEDPELLIHANRLISTGKSAAFAWHAVIEDRCAALAATGNPLLAGRVTDLHDIEQQVLRKLAGQDLPAMDLPHGAVLLADDLMPSDFPALVRAQIAAIVTAQGGPTSHVAILARGQGIPMLVAVGPQLAEIRDGALLIVDAERGLVDTAPTPERIAAAQAEIERRSDIQAALLARAHEKAVTTDGVRIEVAANVSNADDAREAVTRGAESVGLLRTELLFLGREEAPSEADQTAAYQSVIAALEGRPAIIRTLDVGADKSLPYIPMPTEENPALGLRGIRLSLAREVLISEQLRAILAVKPLSAVRIMLPMVADISEIAATRARLDRLSAEMGITERVELGVMIETPAAAVLADQLAQEADFFSVGSNDLTQYTLCMDRTNPALAARLDGLHPAVLRLMAQAAKGAAQHGKWLGLCGALASDPVAVPLLIGLGFSELSVSPAVIPEIKDLVRRLSRAECEAVVQKAMQQTSAAAVRALAREAWPWLGAPAA